MNLSRQHAKHDQRKTQRRTLLAGLVVLGLYDVGSALWMAAAPHSFFVTLGPFAAYNSHYVRDSATYVGAIGVGLLLGVRQAHWRMGALGIFTLQNGLHAINHLVDIHKAHPDWIGVFDAVALLTLTSVGAWLWTLAVGNRTD